MAWYQDVGGAHYGVRESWLSVTMQVSLLWEGSFMYGRISSAVTCPSYEEGSNTSLTLGSYQDPQGRVTFVCIETVYYR